MSESSRKLKVRILGATAVSGVSEGRRVLQPIRGGKGRQILGMLAVRPGEPLAKDELAERLWDGRPPRSYLATLESYVCVLRREIGGGSGRSAALATASRGYVLDPGRVEVDADQVRRLLSAAETASPAGSLAVTDQALALVTGPLLASEPYAAWAEEERGRFDAQFTRGCVRGAATAHALGDHDTALRLAGQALQLDPLSEPAWVLRMASLAGTAQRVEALRCFSEMRRAMVEELGVEPGPEAQRLYLSLLRSAPSQVYDPDQEVRTLLGLLRSALEAVPGIVVPAEDHRLSAVAAEYLGAA